MENKQTQNIIMKSIKPLCFAVLLSILYVMLFDLTAQNNDSLSIQPEAAKWATTFESHFGCQGNLGLPMIGEDPEVYFEAFEELGFKWDRPHLLPFLWNEVESEKGVYDFTKVDNYVLDAQSHGVHILASIFPYVDWDQEYWRRQSGWERSKMFEMVLGNSRYKPHNLKAYRIFVQTLVERYDGDGVDDMPGLLNPIKYWEVMNEPELGFFSGTPSDYLEVHKATYKGVKTADSTAKVIQGGAAGEINPFWIEVFEMGGAQYIDVGNFHADYPSPEAEDLYSTQWVEFYRKYGISTYWITETQIPHSRKDKTDQAIRIVKGYIQAFANGVDKIFYVLYKAPSTGGTQFCKSALVEADGAKKPAFYAMKTMIIKLDNFENIEILGENSYKFMVRGKTVYVLWGSGELPPGVTGMLRVTTYLGEVSELEAASLTQVDYPLYIEIIGL